MNEKTDTCLIRDDRFLEHMPGHTHPDHPSRIKAIYRMLDRELPQVRTLEAKPANLEDIERVHTPSYIKRVMKTAEHDLSSLAPDTPASRGTYLSAWFAAGGCIRALEELMKGDFSRSFCLVRPPGHHAMPGGAGGFCIFNNLAIAARKAIKSFGLKRILIIDWDIHQGNGLSDIFFREKDVLYFSTHDPLIYPFRGDWQESGEGEGEGYTLNIPIPREIEDNDLLYLYQEILGKVFFRYRPELVLVAAGFDGLSSDPIGRNRFTEKVFYGLARIVTDLSAQNGSPPLLLSLEGGYDPRSLAEAVRQVILAFLEQEPEAGLLYEETPGAAELLDKAYSIHGKYGVWCG